MFYIFKGFPNHLVKKRIYSCKTNPPINSHKKLKRVCSISAEAMWAPVSPQTQICRKSELTTFKHDMYYMYKSYEKVRRVRYISAGAMWGPAGGRNIPTNQARYICKDIYKPGKMYTKRIYDIQTRQDICKDNIRYTNQAR